VKAPKIPADAIEHLDADQSEAIVGPDGRDGEPSETLRACPTTVGGASDQEGDRQHHRLCGDDAHRVCRACARRARRASSPRRDGERRGTRRSHAQRPHSSDRRRAPRIASLCPCASLTTRPCAGMAHDGSRPRAEPRFSPFGPCRMRFTHLQPPRACAYRRLVSSRPCVRHPLYGERLPRRFLVNNRRPATGLQCNGGDHPRGSTPRGSGAMTARSG
jgi:hypothetical protein